jgi:hypothetical protein
MMTAYEQADASWRRRKRKDHQSRLCQLCCSLSREETLLHACPNIPDIQTGGCVRHLPRGFIAAARHRGHGAVVRSALWVLKVPITASEHASAYDVEWIANPTYVGTCVFTRRR